MSKKEKREIIIHNVDDVTPSGQMTNEDLMRDSVKYDSDNYNPLGNPDEKVMLVPDNKSEIITIRLTQQENDLLKRYALKNSMSKSSFVRSLVLRALHENESYIYENSNENYGSLKSMLSALSEKVDEIKEYLSKPQK